MGTPHDCSVRVRQPLPSPMSTSSISRSIEYVEAEFYTVTTGKRMKDVSVGTSGTGTAGPTTGGRKLDLAPWMKDVLEEIADDEQQHVLYLRNALGSARIAKPAINLEGITA